MRLIATILLLGFVCTCHAQKSATIKGIVFDTLAKKPVASATITVFKQSDSSLVTFTMTNNSGAFELAGVSSGAYRLLVTHVNYHSTNKLFSISEATKDLDFGQIAVGDKFKTLPEVLVQAEAPPVTLIQDTVEYNAGSFKTKPNANVEELLKKLPGVKVEKDGTVKTQGQTVNKVYVDGKEFFGTDPKVATRNLPADAVDKVQVYDRMSDQSMLTGFDDGNSQKAINLKLKKEKKKGVFGNVSAGVGTDERYDGKFSVNSFKGARQLSAIGTANNINEEGFSFLDILNFSGELGRLKQGGGDININISKDGSNLFSGFGNQGSGIRTTWGGGVNYNDLIGTKLDFRSNYFYNHYNPVVDQQLQRQYFLPDSSYFYNQNSHSDNISNSHRFNLILDYQVDSLLSVRMAPSFSVQDSRNKSISAYQSLSQEKVLTNEGFSNNYSENSGYNFRNDLLVRKKFRKKGRTLSFNLQNSLNNADGNGSQLSVNRFFDPLGNLILSDSINQQNTNSSSLDGYNARLVYTEPISKRFLLELNVAKSNTNSNSEKITYDYNGNSGKFDELNELLTNDYENSYGYTTAGFRFRAQKKKYNWYVGGNWQQADLDGTMINSGKDSVIKKTFQNILPNARFQYNFNKFRNLSINYSTFTNQPSILQLQPVPDISDPLNIKLGNPVLDQEFTHSIQANYFSVNPFKNRNFFTFFSFRKIQHKIVNSDSINNLGIKFTRPVNINGAYNLNGDLNWGFPVKFIKRTTMELSMGIGHAQDKQFINSEENRIRDMQWRPAVRVVTNPNEKINISLNAGTNYYRTKYSLQPELNTNYFTHELGGDFNWELPKNFYFSTEFNYMINTRRADGFNANVPLWNASLSRQFLKLQRGEVKLRVFDILNQNIGITRTSNANYIEDKSVTILKRYFMLSFTYNLNKVGAKMGAGGNFKVITR